MKDTTHSSNITATVLCLLLVLGIGQAQGQVRSLPHFNNIIVSPHVQLVLEHGPQEGVRLESHGVPE
ncbi:MAG: hypothetical protein AAGJ35_15830, partial [Myxococcota bacterium]